MGFKLNPITGKFDLSVTGGVGGIGNVVGPASSINEAIAVYNGTTGKTIKSSNISISTNTIISNNTNGNIIITPDGTGVIQIGKDLEVAAKLIKLGASNQAAISYDGTSLNIDPTVTGSASVVFGQNASTIDGNILFNTAAIGGSALSATAAINGVVTSSAIRTSLNFNLTYSGSSGGLANIVSTSTYTGTATTASNSALLASSVLSTGAVTVSGTHTGIDSRISMANTTALTAGTHVFSAITTSLGQTGNGSHSGGTVRVYGIRQQPMTNTFTGVSSETKWGAFFGNDVALATAARLYLEGSETAKGDSYIVFNSGTTDIDIVVDGTIALNIDNDLVRSEVPLGALAGASTTYSKVGGTINTNTTAVGNVGTGEDDLITYTIPASVLNTNGDRIEFKMAGTFAANVNTKRIRVKYGATTLFDTTAIAFNGTDWSCDGLIIRTGAATQKAYVAFRSSDALLNSSSDYTTPAETLSGTVVLKATGEATSNNDISQEIMNVSWYPVQ